jgi:hypothetical protein
LLEGERLLGSVGVFGTSVEVELLQHPCAELVPWQHPPYSLREDFLGILLEELLEGDTSEVAKVATVADVDFPLLLLSLEEDLRNVDDDDMVSVHGVGSPGRLMFPTEHVGDPCREASERKAARVDEVP